jgi:NAD(P)-dependent dehydrogenase (short-subunit alcohol dehydrogenase family)
MANRLAAKTALATGESTGIGVAATQEFEAERAYVLFLAYDDARYVIGSELFVDGGQAQV